MNNSQQVPQNKQPNPIMITIGAVLIAGLCGFAGIVIGVIVIGDGGPSTSETSAPPVPKATPTNTIITDEGVLRRIETTSILQTTIYRIDTVVRAKKEGSWFFNWGGQNIILFVQGNVTAGIDLSELKESDIQVSQDKRTITINLPPVKILNATLDQYTVETFEGEQPDDVDLTLLQEGLEAGKVKIREIACTDRILERATTDSKKVFQDMMNLVDFDDFVLIVESSPIPECAFEVKEL